MLLLILLGSISLQAWAWWSLRRRVLAGSLTKLGAVVRYSAWALAPLMLLVGLFLGVIGLEEVTGAAILPELLGRAALPTGAALLGIAAVALLSFCVQVAAINPGSRAKA